MCRVLRAGGRRHPPHHGAGSWQKPLVPALCARECGVPEGLSSQHLSRGTLQATSPTRALFSFPSDCNGGVAVGSCIPDHVHRFLLHLEGQGTGGTATACPHSPPGPGHWSGAELPRVLLSLSTGAGAVLAWLWPQQEQAGGRGHRGLPAQDGGCPSPSTVLCARGDGAPRGRLQSHPVMPLGRIKENYSLARRHEL